MISTFVILILFILALFKFYHMSILLEDDIYDYYYGASLVFEDNIPYKFSAFRLNDRYLLSYPHYYNIPKIERYYQDVSDLFIELCKLDYIETQSNPNILFQDGGNCQAFAIYVCAVLTEMGYDNGFIPSINHICNWVVLEDGVYRIDIVRRSFTKFSDNELNWLKEVEDEMR